MTSEYQKMIAGEPYHPFDPSCGPWLRLLAKKQSAFNKEEDPLKGAEIIKTWFGLDWTKYLCQSTPGGRLWG